MKTKSFVNKFYALCFVLLALSCGKEGPPIIPQLVAPNAVNTLHAKMGCQRIILEFIKPALNTDGTVFKNLYGFQLYRQRMIAVLPDSISKSSTLKELQKKTNINKKTSEEKMNHPEKKSSRWDDLISKEKTAKTLSEKGLSLREEDEYIFAHLVWKPLDKKFKKVREFSVKELKDIVGAGFIHSERYPKGKTPIRFFDSGERLKRGFEHISDHIYLYKYRIRLINDNDDYSAFSNTYKVYFALPAAPPEDLQFERIDNSVRLFWDPPDKLCDHSPLLKKNIYFNIYRREKNKAYIQQPLNKNLLSEMNFLVKDLRLDFTYYFQVKSVILNPYRESVSGTEIEVLLKDLTPPEVPKNLIAIAGYKLVSLLWDKSTEDDLAGYYLYRRVKGSTKWVKLNNKIIVGNTWIDRTVDINKAYSYAITAVDSSPQKNESKYSAIRSIDFKLN